MSSQGISLTWIRYYIDTEVTPVRKQSKVTITSEVVEQPRVIMVCVCVLCVCACVLYVCCEGECVCCMQLYSTVQRVILTKEKFDEFTIFQH